MSLDRSNKIPIIDLSSSVFNDNPEKLTEEITKAYTASGLGIAYIVGHGVEQQKIQAIFEQSKCFHALPDADKMLLKQGHSSLGYIPMGSSTLIKSTLGSAKLPNQSAAFLLSQELEHEEKPFYGYNQWPPEAILPSFKATANSYIESMIVLMQRLLILFSRALTGSDHAFQSYFIPPTVFLRLQYYPAFSSQNNQNQYGLAPHTDYGAMTLLAQDGIGGLQVKQPNGTWLDVPPIPDSFVLNIGDMLQHMSNNHFIATPHRVVNASNQDRYSIPLFFDPNIYSVIQPIDENNQKILSHPIIYKDYLLDRIKHNYPVEIS